MMRFRTILGETEHVRWLGRSSRNHRDENGDIVGRLIDRVFVTGEAACADDQLHRRSKLAARGSLLHVLVQPDQRRRRGSRRGYWLVRRDDRRVISEQRLRALRDLATSMTASANLDDKCTNSANVLTANARDVAFCLIYVVDDRAGRADLAAASGVDSGTDLAPTSVDLTSPDQAWPLGDVCRTGQSELAGTFRGNTASRQAGRRARPPTRL